MSSRHHQRGAVLFVSLIMLVMITLFVVSSINLSSADLRIIGNLQSKRAMNQSAQQAIEQVISSIANFDGPVPQTITVNGIPVSVSAAGCLGTTTATGYSAVSNITVYDTNWSLTATATDPVTGATATVTQGVRIRMPTNYCP
jgi:Tfp pilus assembly protein PilX